MLSEISLNTESTQDEIPLMLSQHRRDSAYAMSTWNEIPGMLSQHGMRFPVFESMRKEIPLSRLSLAGVILF